MVELKEEQMSFLKKYNTLLDTISEGFEYLEEKIPADAEAPPQAQQVFADILQSFQQLNQSHHQIKEILGHKHKLGNIFQDFHEVVGFLSQWFEKSSSQAKKELLSSYIIPNFESWRYNMQGLLKRYITH